MKEAAPPLPFANSLIGGQIIAEMKRSSPSGGILDIDLNPAQRAETYVNAGAAAISVLTEEDHFRGSLDDLTACKKVCHAHGIPVIRKDFIFDEYQLWEARAAGADSVLLIAGILDFSTYSDLLQATRSLGMEPLIEIHSAHELNFVLKANPKVVGINNRNLTTLQTTLGTFERLAPFVPDGVIKVAESGMKSAADVRRMFASGAEAVLVGESLMRAGSGAGTMISEMRNSFHTLRGRSNEG